MGTPFLALILKSFLAVAFLAVARGLSVLILARLPEGRLKRFLLIRW